MKFIHHHPRLAIAVAVVFALSLFGYATLAETVFPPTEERLANIEGTLGIVYPTATSEANDEPTATDVPEPTATDVPPTATDEPSDDLAGWHAATDHEHGDEPPQWVTAFSQATFGHGVIYGGDEGTPNENVTKHEAFKGQVVPSAAGGEAYVRFHAQSNPHGRAAQFHSFELYYRDTQGGVTFFQGWLDCGDPDTRRFPRSQGDPGLRPAMLVVDQSAWDRGIRTEQWYCKSPLVEIGVNIGQTTTVWHPGEHLNDPHDQANWDVTGQFGTKRLVDFFLIESRYQGFVGTFCTDVRHTQQMDCDDPAAVEQIIAPTMYDDMRTEFGVRRISGQSQPTFSCGQCQLPN